MNLPVSNTIYSQYYVILTIVFCIITCGFNPANSKKKESNLPKSGVNMTWQTTSYLTSSLAFTNAMKNCSGWEDSTIVRLDRHGYPLILEDGQRATTSVFRENKYYPAGEYTLQWEGTGVISLSTCNQRLTFGPDDKRSQIISVTNTNCREGIQLTIESTRKNDHIRNIRFYLPGYDEDSGTWTDHFIDFHAQFGVTRFAWGSGLYCLQTRWNERSEMQDLNWTDNGSNPTEDNGIPYEAMV